MIEGELYQLTKNGDAGITEEEHFDIIRRKTAYLFGGCAQIGGMLGKVSTRAASRRCGVRLQPRHRVSAGRRPARLHRRRRGARQADRRRPARRQDDAAAHPPAAAGRRRARPADHPRHHRRAHRDAGAVARAAAAASRSTRRSTTRTAAPSSSPSAPRSRSTRSRRARSATRCSRCPTTCCRETGDARRCIGMHACRSRRIRELRDADPPSRRALLHPQRSRDLRRGVRPAAARARAARGGASRSRHARFADAARRRPAGRRLRDRRAPRADAQPRQRLQRGGAARVRRARAQGRAASATRRSRTSPS